MDSKFYSILSLLAYCNPEDFDPEIINTGNAKQRLINILVCRLGETQRIK